jgi:DNA polymerase-3 subunit alpha
LDGNCRLEIGYSLPSVKGKLKMGSQWRVQPRDELIGRLRDEFGNNSVTLIYD